MVRFQSRAQHVHVEADVAGTSDDGSLLLAVKVQARLTMPTSPLPRYPLLPFSLTEQVSGAPGSGLLPPSVQRMSWKGSA